MSENSAIVCRPAIWLMLLGLVGAAFNPAIGQERVQDHTRILRELAPIDYLSEHGGPSAGRIDLRIVFDVNKATLRPHAIRQLNELGIALKSDQLKSMQFLIVGHTDASGPAAHNKRLSLARARAVKSWLVRRHGIAAGRLDVEGRGEERLKDPLVPDSRVNRRVEIVRLAQSGGARGRARAAASGGTSSGTGEDLSADLGAGWARGDLKRQSKAANFVASKAREEGRVRVIVGVKTPRRPPADGFQSLQNYIANVQQEAMGSLGWVNFNDLVRLKHTPQLVMSVDARELDQLIQSERVASVHEDAPNRAFLSRSVGVIGRPVTNRVASIGAGQVVAVLDTGIDRHPFIAPNIAAEACFSTSRILKDAKISSACPNGATQQVGPGAGRACDHRYDCSHGTHVAGIVVGKSAQFSGVAPGAKILAVQVFSLIDSRDTCANRSGKCGTSFTSDLIRALSWVYEQRDRYNIAAVNLSLGGGRYAGSCGGDALRPIFDLLWGAGIAMVVASGNEEFTDSMSSPACIPNAIAVGATGYADKVAKFSNSSSALDLLAPGTSVVPERRGSGILSSVLNGKFARMGGTSMAAPHVAGAFAVIKSSLPDAKVGDVLKALKVTGVRVRDSKNGLVRPRIRIDAAIRYLRKLAARPKTPSPAPKQEPKPAPQPKVKNYDGIRVFDGRKN